jgi:hypothetical protein
MPAIINSAPDCVSSDPGTTDDRIADSADFVMGDPYVECTGFMTFGPGSTYGEEGVGATGAYMALTWIGIVVMVLVFVGWIVYENRRLVNYVKGVGVGFDEPDVPQPGLTPDPEN